MPLSVQANHAFVDGIHIRKFVDRLQKYLYLVFYYSKSFSLTGNSMEKFPKAPWAAS